MSRSSKSFNPKSLFSRVLKFSPVFVLAIGIVGLCLLIVPLRNASTTSLFNDQNPPIAQADNAVVMGPRAGISAEAVNANAYVVNDAAMTPRATSVSSNKDTPNIEISDKAVYSTASADIRPAITNNGIEQKTLQDKVAQSPVLVEMFLSQSCSSCVPAARYVGDLAKRDDVVVISWHVDYWDRLNTHSGRWKDPYSDRSYTLRQRDYSINSSANGRIYTPQAIINGRMEAVGSRRSEVENYITAARTSVNNPVLVSIDDSKQASRTLEIKLDGGIEPSQVLLVSFLRETQTSILGGENAGIDWNEANVVFDVQNLGAIGGDIEMVKAQLPNAVDGQKAGCAVLIQSDTLGPVSHAAYCPF